MAITYKIPVQKLRVIQRVASDAGELLPVSASCGQRAIFAARLVEPVKAAFLSEIRGWLPKAPPGVIHPTSVVGLLAIYFGVSSRTIDAARNILAETPELVPLVESNQMSIAAAEKKVREARALRVNQLAQRTSAKRLKQERLPVDMAAVRRKADQIKQACLTGK